MEPTLMEPSALVGILQAAIGPFVLISGIGLILLSLTNRIARPTDLVRRLLSELDQVAQEDIPFLLEELKLLNKRCRILRGSIALSVAAIACAAGMVLTLFAGLLFKLHLALPVALLFVGCLASLLASLLVFLWDIKITLHSLAIETDRRTRKL